MDSNLGPPAVKAPALPLSHNVLTDGPGWRQAINKKSKVNKKQKFFDETGNRTRTSSFVVHSLSTLPTVRIC